MKIVITGGTGQLGEILRRDFEKTGDEVIIISRREKDEDRKWDSLRLGSWVRHFEKADAIINLAGRTVNCRYTKENLRQMMDSRVDSTRVVGEAIRHAKHPPKLWLQMSTATIYRHTFGAANDEFTGVIGGGESGVPRYYDFSVDIAKAWEATQAQAKTPKTRQVAMRTAMVMSPDKGGVFSVLKNLSRFGLGGAIAGGNQFVSWIHYRDFCAAVRFVIAKKSLKGPINFTAPEPLAQSEMMRTLRNAIGMPIGLPATKWMAEIGAFFLRTDTELLLKSRRVVPGRLLKEGFRFEFASWKHAALDLAR